MGTHYLCAENEVWHLKQFWLTAEEAGSRR